MCDSKITHVPSSLGRAIQKIAIQNKVHKILHFMFFANNDFGLKILQRSYP